MQLKIVRIHNELLGTYGDRGNADVLAYRAGFNGIVAHIVDVSFHPFVLRQNIFPQFICLGLFLRKRQISQLFHKNSETTFE